MRLPSTFPAVSVHHPQDRFRQNLGLLISIQEAAYFLSEFQDFPGWPEFFWYDRGMAHKNIIPPYGASLYRDAILDTLNLLPGDWKVGQTYSTLTPHTLYSLCRMMAYERGYAAGGIANSPAFSPANPWPWADELTAAEVWLVTECLA